MTVKHARDVETIKIQAAEKTQMQVLIASKEGPNFAMRRFVIEPGGGMPNHTNSVEHEQYILKGHARIGIGDLTYDVSAGDVIYIPSGEKHWYKNSSEETFEFLCMVPNKPDHIMFVGNGC